MRQESSGRGTVHPWSDASAEICFSLGERVFGAIDGCPGTVVAPLVAVETRNLSGRHDFDTKGLAMGVVRQTHTYAELEISRSAYDEIRGLLKAAGYQHAFMDDGTIDMHGIGITRQGGAQLLDDPVIFNEFCEIGVCQAQDCRVSGTCLCKREAKYVAPDTDAA